jgi:diphthamide biosynthesis protein 7
VSRHLIKRIDTDSAILDLHFMRDSLTFVVVSSTGTISFYRLTLEKNVTPQPRSQTLADIELIATNCPFRGESPLILSFDFYRPDAKSLKLDSNIPQPLLLLTTSLGHVWLIRVAHDFQDLEVLNYGNPIIKHGDNTWCCIFAQFNTVFSGGDDSKVRLAYLDSPLSPALGKNVFTEPLTEAQSVLSGHEAGVTAILELPCPESPDGFVLLTGSFDDHVRVYATHYHPYLAPDKPPKTLAKLKIGDGVWRLKFLNEPPLPEDSMAEINDSVTKVKYRILASCMRKGARILEIVRSSSGEWTIDVLAKYCNHQSMNYASDVQPVSTKSALEQDQKRICVTTSFYDKSLCIWKWDPSITVTSQDMAKVEEVVV